MERDQWYSSGRGSSYPCKHWDPERGGKRTAGRCPRRPGPLRLRSRSGRSVRGRRRGEGRRGTSATPPPSAHRPAHSWDAEQWMNKFCSRWEGLAETNTISPQGAGGNVSSLQRTLGERGTSAWGVGCVSPWVGIWGRGEVYK